MTGNAFRRKRAALAEIVFERLAAADLEPRGELGYLNPFSLSRERPLSSAGFLTDLALPRTPCEKLQGTGRGPVTCVRGVGG